VFKDFRTSRVFPILFNFTCDTSHCVYLIFCSRCFIFYVGQTSNSVRVRIREHLRAISVADRTSSVADHFSQECGLHSFRWLVIDRCFNTERRLQKETLRTLRSQQPLGLNRSAGQSSPKVNLVTFPALCTSRLSSVIRDACRAHNVQVRLCYKTDRSLAAHLK